LVHAMGFAPGFPYLGGLPAKLSVPRRATPRPAVPAGSVGIGGAQTGIYPLATPGGWQIIGRTPLALFRPGATEPALLRVGDGVKFRAITPGELVAWK
ncbi:MAG: carboxyltransferase domain-containing protein, partial [Opitutales bacterium]|nr:carboxyltransferase domain-containing protein [Opitutales bacterium]